jgi:hypothetical protein
MPRKRLPERREFVQRKISVPLDLDVHLEAEARKKRVSYGREVINNLWESQVRRPHYTLDETAAFYRQYMERLDRREREQEARFNALLDRHERLLQRLENWEKGGKS